MRRAKHLTAAGRLLEDVFLGVLAGVIDDGSNLHVLPTVTRCHGKQEFATVNGSGDHQLRT